MIHLSRTTGEPRAGCSKGPSSKAAASEEVKRYGPHFLYSFALVMNLGERISPFSISDIRGAPLNVELLSDARTPLAGFFSILPIKEGRT
jgi:hypothetical protein